MTVRKWSEIRAQKLSPEELRQIDQEVERELLEMDLRALPVRSGDRYTCAYKWSACYGTSDPLPRRGD